MEKPENDLPVEDFSNQTQFGEEEPLFENASLPTAPATLSEEVPPKKPQKIWQNKFFLGGAVCLALVLVFLTLMFAQPRRRIQQILQNGTKPSPRPTQTVLQQRVDEVKQDLQNADPTQTDLPFPPINKSIFIDQPAQ